MDKLQAVAIDGPAGAGKSTVAGALAARLGWTYVDTGAMYRAAALAALREGVELESADAEEIARCARRARIEFLSQEGREENLGAGSAQRVILDGEDVTAAVREPELTQRVRHVARCAPARAELVKKQRAFAEAGPVVMEGRDIGTVVMPDAAAKFYLDARLEERARRRARDLERAGQLVTGGALRRCAPPTSADLQNRPNARRKVRPLTTGGRLPAGCETSIEALMEEIKSRDESDIGRAASPLRPAADAEIVDTTDLTVQEVVDLLERRVRERMGEVSGRAR